MVSDLRSCTMLSTLPLFYIAQSVNSDDRRTRIQGLRVIMIHTQTNITYMVSCTLPSFLRLVYMALQLLDHWFASLPALFPSRWTTTIVGFMSRISTTKTFDFSCTRVPFVIRLSSHTIHFTTDLTTSSFKLTGLFFRFLNRTNNFS